MEEIEATTLSNKEEESLLDAFLILRKLLQALDEISESMKQVRATLEGMEPKQEREGV